MLLKIFCAVETLFVVFRYRLYADALFLNQKVDVDSHAEENPSTPEALETGVALVGVEGVVGVGVCTVVDCDEPITSNDGLNATPPWNPNIADPLSCPA